MNQLYDGLLSQQLPWLVAFQIGEEFGAVVRAASSDILDVKAEFVSRTGVAVMGLMSAPTDKQLKELSEIRGWRLRRADGTGVIPTFHPAVIEVSGQKPRTVINVAFRAAGAAFSARSDTALRVSANVEEYA